MRVATYIRVSTEEQGRHGLSVAAQTEALRRYVDEHHYNLVGEFFDVGISARQPYKKRPALLQLLEAVQNDQLDLILFIKLDRWFRNIQAYYEVQPILDKHNVAWQAIHESYETLTANGRLKVNIMLSIAQDEADRTSERIRFVFDGKKERGEVLSGHVGLGFRVEGKHRVVDEEAAGIVREMFRYYIDCRSLTATQRMLQSEYGIQRSYHNVREMLTSKKYLEIIDRPTFVKAQELLASKSHARNAVGKVYLFSGLIYCKQCGGRFKTHLAGKYTYYYCRTHEQYRTCSCYKHYNEAVIEQFLLDNIVSAIKDYNVSVMEKQQPPVDTARINKRIEKLRELFMDDLISKEVYAAEYRLLEKQLEIPLNAPKTISVDGVEEMLQKYHELSKASQKALWGRIVKRIECDCDGNIFLTV